MPTPTYDLIASNVTTSEVFEINFTSIPSTYRDLVIVADIKAVASSNIRMRFNADTGSNYNSVFMRGNGSSTSSGLQSSDTFVQLHDANTPATPAIFGSIIQILDYAQTNKHKSGIARTNLPTTGVWATSFRWASTSAITSIRLSTANDGWPAGSSFYLYGIVS